MLVCSLKLTAQEVKLKKDEDKSVYNKESGADQKVYRFMFFDFGQIVSDNSIMPGNSWTWAYGMKIKFRITSVINIINGYQYRHLAYRLEQNSSKTFPDVFIHTKQRYALHQFGTDLALRLNLDRHGNSISWFVDLGGYASVSPFARLKTTDTYGNSSLAKVSKTIQRDLQFPQRFEYGLTTRIGFTRYALFANYRLSKMFKSKYNFTELPNLVVGVQLGMHK